MNIVSLNRTYLVIEASEQLGKSVDAKFVEVPLDVGAGEAAVGAEPEASVLHYDGAIHNASRGAALLAADVAGVTLLMRICCTPHPLI